MSIFEDKTIKPKSSTLWIFAPIVAVLIGIILWYNFVSAEEFSWTLFWIIIVAVTLLLIIWKVFIYINSSSKEVREYEKEMAKRGRR